MDLAHRIAHGPTVALGEIRKLARTSWDNSYTRQLALEERIQPATFRTKDAAEGMQAMLAKRPPRFRGE